jgi:hypothetical protein
MHLQVQRIQGLGIDPIVDYLIPIWPTINCFNPARSDNSPVIPSQSFVNYLTAIQNKAAQFTQSGLFFTAQCVSSQAPALYWTGKSNISMMI